jgi:hypothetical protein
VLRGEENGGDKQAEDASASWILDLRFQYDAHLGCRMRILLKIVIGLVLLVGGVIGAILWHEPSGTLNYKLSVDVDDNGTLHHGEGVLQIAYQGNLWMPMSQGAPWSAGLAYGEAVVIDLGSKGLLFAVPQADPYKDLSSKGGFTKFTVVAEPGQAAIYKYFDFGFNGLPGDRSALATIDAFKKSAQSVDINPFDLPLLVRFRDINDPSSIERVDPDHLDQSFGSGVSIARASAAITEEPVTTGIENRLPDWFKIMQSRIAENRTAHTEYTKHPISPADQFSAGSLKRHTP